MWKRLFLEDLFTLRLAFLTLDFYPYHLTSWFPYAYESDFSVHVNKYKVKKRAITMWIYVVEVR